MVTIFILAKISVFRIFGHERIDGHLDRPTFRNFITSPSKRKRERERAREREREKERERGGESAQLKQKSP